MGEEKIGMTIATKNNFMNRSWRKLESLYFKKLILPGVIVSGCLLQSLIISAQQNRHPVVTGNPVIKNKYTADPGAFVYKDAVYLYTGHDEAPAGKDGYIMHEWLCFSSTDMVNWKEHPVPLTVKDFKWAKDDAWASQVIERNGKFYWYVATEHAAIPGKAIGVAVADNPTGPFKDARGSALITNDMTSAESKMMWDDIDPSVIMDTDGQAYLFWGNRKCYYAKLKQSMTEIDGEIKTIELPDYTEAPWIHRHNGWYYLSYASSFPEKISYAMSRSINGPWKYKGILNEVAGNSNTNHQAIIGFKGKSYFIYHNGSLPPDGGSFRRSVCIDYLYYNKDGTMKRIVMTTEGVKSAKYRE
jgi:beta-xylosidase